LILINYLHSILVHKTNNIYFLWGHVCVRTYALSFSTSLRSRVQLFVISLRTKCTEEAVRKSVVACTNLRGEDDDTMVWVIAGGTGKELRSACPATVKTRFQEILPFPHKSHRSSNDIIRHR